MEVLSILYKVHCGWKFAVLFINAKVLVLSA